MAYETIDFTVSEGIGRITLTRPEAANGINHQFARELKSAAEACRDDTRVRAVILAAEGPIFSAGGDLRA
ncbi:MAG: enoyl-CoA hydratase-related protein, partial [Caulobacterales bacterium]|nr:enoyl-CoA hydratase-related protein [Caulobacterales bacterium]